jgi:1-acyl-sn-glycerol-3-phosphate acyltransferase
MLLESCEVQVVPTVIEGAFEAFPPGHPLPRPGKIRVTFGQPLDVDALKRSNDSEVHEQIAAALQAHVDSMSDGGNDDER